MKYVLCLMMLLLSACARFSETECVWTTEIRPSKADALTRGTLDQILTHNLNRQKFCQ